MMNLYPLITKVLCQILDLYASTSSTNHKDAVIQMLARAKQFTEECKVLSVELSCKLDSLCKLAI